MAYQLPELTYSYDALEPYIDARTMQIHHAKHHGGYVAKLNAALEGRPELSEKTVEELLGQLQVLPKEIQTAIRNNGGGHANHSLFWKVLSPQGGGEPVGVIAERLRDDFGSFSEFKGFFSAAAVARFGSGWAWLCVNSAGTLCVCSTPNQDNPLMQDADCPGVPILGLDVWEHAYYLKYQNKRPEYIEAFWNTLNWDQVEENYLRALN